MTNENERKPRLGQAEKAALIAMVQRGGVWEKESKWVWESTHWTVELMDSLSRKGFAEPLEPGARYQLTAQGKALATELLLPFVQIHAQRRSQPVQLPRQGSYRTMGGWRGTSR